MYRRLGGPRAGYILYIHTYMCKSNKQFLVSEEEEILGYMKDCEVETTPHNNFPISVKGKTYRSRH
jgi:hypothetical protein